MRPEIMRDVWDVGRGRQQSCRLGVRFRFFAGQGGVICALFGKQVCCAALLHCRPQKKRIVVGPATLRPPRLQMIRHNSQGRLMLISGLH